MYVCMYVCLSPAFVLLVYRPFVRTQRTTRFSFARIMCSPASKNGRAFVVVGPLHVV